jgi:hypothetical protein
MGNASRCRKDATRPRTPKEGLIIGPPSSRNSRRQRVCALVAALLLGSSMLLPAVSGALFNASIDPTLYGDLDQDNVPFMGDCACGPTSVENFIRVSAKRSSECLRPERPGVSFRIADSRTGRHCLARHWTNWTVFIPPASAGRFAQLNRVLKFTCNQHVVTGRFRGGRGLADAKSKDAARSAEASPSHITFIGATRAGV